MSDQTLLSSSLSEAPEGQQRKLSVLVVESDSQALKDLRKTLLTAGYDVHSESSSEAVLKQKDLAAFAAVLLDRHLDDRLLPHIRRNAPHVPIIIMSPQPDVREAVTALWQGASDYLTKPIPPAMLRMSLEQVLSQPRQEEAHQPERAFWDNLLDLAPIIILVLDARGRIVRFNRFLEELSGYRLDEVQGRDWFETFLPEEDRPQIREAYRQVLSGEMVSGDVNPLITRDGHQRQISWRCRAYSDADGQVSGILATGQDVTDQLQAQSQSGRMERLAVIGQTIAAVSHEARNELFGLKMGLDVLRSALDDRDNAGKIIDELEEAQARLSRLFEDVRGFAAPMQLERLQYNLPKVWRKAWDSLESLREGREAVLSEELFAPTIDCDVDGFRMEEVFRNLFENSLAAGDDPVKIHITCAPAKLDGREAVAITMRDNGPGLTPDQHDKLFEAFFTTKSRGTGLGLALVKRIIEAHQGTIAVNPEISEGTEFNIILPVAE